MVWMDGYVNACQSPSHCCRRTIDVPMSRGGVLIGGGDVSGGGGGGSSSGGGGGCEGGVLVAVGVLLVG